MELARILRPLTLDDVKQSYESLKVAPCVDSLNLGRAGISALDYFFLQHRIKAKNRTHHSFYEDMKNPVIVKKLTELVAQYKKKDPESLSREELIRQQYSVFQLYYGTVNQFRPVVAKFVYCQLKPTVGVMDFSAGWGGRCLGAVAMGIPYVGVDANTKLKTAYDRMIQTLEPSANVKLFFQPSETFDFSKHKYDLILTSPPYFTIEQYEHMPEYGSKQGFLDKFFIPVVMNAWKHLQRNGHMALNMPAEMYEAIRSHLPKLKKTFVMPISNRNPVSAVKQLELKNAPRSELIYVWQKKGGQGQGHRVTRKNKNKK